jgi:hypothetical protein
MDGFDIEVPQGRGYVAHILPWLCIKLAPSF